MAGLRQMKQQLTQLKEEGKSAVLAGDVNAVSNSSRQKISRHVADPSRPIYLCDLSDVYRALHPTAAQAHSLQVNMEQSPGQTVFLVVKHSSINLNWSTLCKDHRPSICKITLCPWSTIKRGVPITILKFLLPNWKKNLSKSLVLPRVKVQIASDASFLVYWN